MTQRTSIEWATYVWNFLRGCSEVSSGCDFCYARDMARRFGAPGQWGEGLTTSGPTGVRWTGRIKVVESALNGPLTLTSPERIFVASVSDTFHVRVSRETMLRALDVMRRARHHQYVMLTKRPSRMRVFLHGLKDLPGGLVAGTSAEDQRTVDARLPSLCATNAPWRLVSLEPLLGPVDIGPWLEGEDHLDGVIVGGESGQRARPMHPEWVRDIRDACTRAGVRFFFKQWGTWEPLPVGTEEKKRLVAILRDGTVRNDGHSIGRARRGADGAVLMQRNGKGASGRELDGVTHSELIPLPGDVRVPVRHHLPVVL